MAFNKRGAETLVKKLWSDEVERNLKMKWPDTNEESERAHLLVKRLLRAGQTQFHAKATYPTCRAELGRRDLRSSIGEPPRPVIKASRQPHHMRPFTEKNNHISAASYMRPQ